MLECGIIFIYLNFNLSQFASNKNLVTKLQAWIQQRPDQITLNRHYWTAVSSYNRCSVTAKPCIHKKNNHVRFTVYALPVRIRNKYEFHLSADIILVWFFSNFQFFQLLWKNEFQIHCSVIISALRCDLLKNESFSNPCIKWKSNFRFFAGRRHTVLRCDEIHSFRILFFCSIPSTIEELILTTQKTKRFNWLYEPEKLFRCTMLIAKL